MLPVSGSCRLEHQRRRRFFCELSKLDNFSRILFNFASCKSLDLSKSSILARTVSSLFEAESVLDICKVLDLVLALI